MNEELEMLREDLEAQIRVLVSSLSSSNSDIGDWKVIKCYEASLQGTEMPYDLATLLAKRQLARDEINSLQKRLEELEEE